MDDDDLEAARDVNAALAGDLRAVGAADAWDRLYAADLRDDLSTRLALEGAVEGRRWMRLDPDVRERCAQHVARRRLG